MDNAPFEDVYPTKNGDIPASYVSLPEGFCLFQDMINKDTVGVHSFARLLTPGLDGTDLWQRNCDTLKQSNISQGNHHVWYNVRTVGVCFFVNVL